MSLLDSSGRKLELPAWLWLWLPVGLFTAVYASHFLGREFYMRFVFSESGFVENLTVFFLLVAVASGVMMLRHRQFPERLLGPWIVILTLGCFYFAGEEASWGQHLVGWRTPAAWANVNDQQETNIHNTIGLFDQVPRMALAIAALAGGILIPFVRRRQISIQPFLGVPHWYLATLVCTPAAILSLTTSLPNKIAAAIGIQAPHILRVARGECKELYLALFLMLYVVSLHVRLRGHSDCALSRNPKPSATSPPLAQRLSA